MLDSESTRRPLRRNAKNDVFCHMFSQKEFLLELYRDLHPEDNETVESDLKLVTIERVVTTGAYNDLGFLARGKLVVLVEAQSTWSLNIASRMLLYLAETYREILSDVPGGLHNTSTITLPAPELYVIYTGTQSVPESISFNADILGGAGKEFDFTVRVLTNSEGIVGEYVEFSQLFDKIASSKETTGWKAKELLDSCIQRGILSRYLHSRYKEVEDIMFTLFDQEEVTRYYENELKEKAQAEGMEKGIAEGLQKGIAEGMEKGIAEGLQKGIAEGKAEAVKSLMAKLSISVNEALDLADVSDELKPAVLELLK